MTIQISVYSDLNIQIDNFNIVDRYQHYAVSNNYIHLSLDNKLDIRQDIIVNDISELIGINTKILNKCIVGTMVLNQIAFYLDAVPLINDNFINSVTEFNDIQFNIDYDDHKLIQFNNYSLELSDYTEKKLVSDYSINTLINSRG